MPRSLPTSSYAVLGLLSLTPMSGYELAQAADKSIAHFWPMSKTQIYGELGRLDSLGLVEGTFVEQERVPDKRTFHVTEAGFRVLQEWLEAEGYQSPTFRIPALVKVFFGHLMTRRRLLELLDDYAAELGQEVERMRAITPLLEGFPKAAHAWAAALYGLRILEACEAWTHEVRDRLADAHRMENPTDWSVDSVELARDLFAAVPDHMAPRRRARSKSER